MYYYIDQKDQQIREISTNTNHSAKYSCSVRIVETIRAPWHGGFEYIPRTINVNCDFTAGIFSLSFTITVRFPIRSSKINYPD